MITVISNSPPLILLSKVNRLEILKKLWNEIFIPEAVKEIYTLKQNGLWLKDSLFNRIIKDLKRENKT